jgi:hypothetical protein
MNLRTAILKEHSKAQTMLVVSYVGKDKKRLTELMKLFLGNEYRVTQRAAWAVSICFEQYPELAKPWLKKMILNLTKPGLHDAVRRNTFRLLQFIAIPSSLQGILADTAFRMLSSSEEPVAVKVFAMTVLLNICKGQPGLKNELKLVIEEQFDGGTAGYKSRAKKVLKELTNISDH